jgi:uncharacterized membrane protein
MNLAKNTESKKEDPSTIPYQPTHHQRFQRNKWNIPFIGILLFFLYSLDALTSVQFKAVVVLFLIITVVQTVNTYRKWKEEQREETN